MASRFPDQLLVPHSPDPNRGTCWDQEILEDEPDWDEAARRRTRGVSKKKKAERFCLVPLVSVSQRPHTSLELAPHVLFWAFLGPPLFSMNQAVVVLPGS